MTSDCPTREELTEYLVGKLDEQRCEQFDVHLLQCVNCQTILETVVSPSDTFLPRLRQPVAAGAARGDASDTAERRESVLQEPELQDALLRVRLLAGDTINGDLSSTVAEPVPSQIGPYRILSMLGQGGMGTVFKALHTRLDRIVAIKVLPPQSLRTQDAESRFAREMRAVGKLDHPHIVRASDADEDNGRHYLVMELVDGCDLAELVRRHGPLPIAEACEVARQVASGLQCAHQHGLVHRDIKPSNIMLTYGGEVKILDFGLALLADDLQLGELTSVGQVMGTLDYVAPEQVDNSHTVDIRADLYSLGATMFKLLTGDPLFAHPDRQSPLQKLATLSQDTPPSIGSRRADVPEELAAIIDRLVARRPEDRFSTPADVAAALAPLASSADLSTLLSGERSSDHRGLGSHPELQAESLPHPLATNGDRAPSNATAASALTAASAPPRSRGGWARLVFGGILASALAAVVYFLQTPHGVVRIDIQDPEIHVVLNQTGATFHGIDRRHEVTVRAGEHGLTITRHDLTFETNKFVLHRGETTRLDVQLLAGEVHVLRDGHLLDRRPLPVNDAHERPEADAPEPVPAMHGGPDPPPRVNDYDALATGRWIPVLTDSNPKLSLRRAVIAEGRIEVSDGHAYDPTIKAADCIVRGQVKRSSGQSVMLTLRDVLGVYYSAFYVNEGTEAVGIGMRGVRFRYGVKRQFAVSSGVKDGDFFELACSAIGEVLTVYVNGREVGQLVDRDITRAGGFAVHATRGQGVFQNVEVMVLDQPAR